MNLEVSNGDTIDEQCSHTAVDEQCSHTAVAHVRMFDPAASSKHAAGRIRAQPGPQSLASGTILAQNGRVHRQA